MYSLRTLGHILLGNDDQQSQQVLKAGGLDPFISLLGVKNAKILLDVLFILEIMIIRNQEVVSLIVNNAIYMEKMMCLMNSDFINDCQVLN